MEITSLTKAVTFTTEENGYGEVFHFVWNGSCTVNIYRAEFDRGVLHMQPYGLDVFTIYGEDGGPADEAQVVKAIQEWLAERAGEEE